jgi:hypothetical protein
MVMRLSPDPRSPPLLLRGDIVGVFLQEVQEVCFGMSARKPKYQRTCRICDDPVRNHQFMSRRLQKWCVCTVAVVVLEVPTPSNSKNNSSGFSGELELRRRNYYFHAEH